MNGEFSEEYFFVVLGLTVPHYEPERLSAAGHMVYTSKREQRVQVSPSHITPIVIIWTVRITTGAPLSGFWSQSLLVVFKRFLCFSLF